MSLGAQLRALNANAARFRQQLFGTATDDVLVQVEYNDGEWTVNGYYAPIKKSVLTEEAGFIDVLMGVVRIIKPTPSVPELHKHITLRETTTGDETRDMNLVITDVGGFHPSSAEWVLNVSALNS